MKHHEWNFEKNEVVKRERGVSFEQILLLLEEGRVLDIIENPSGRHPGQMAYVVEIDHYVYFVPYVETANAVFLKTIIPSRKLTRRYLGEKR